MVPPSTNLSPSLENMTTLMKLSSYNWFEFYLRILAETGDCSDDWDSFNKLSQLPNLLIKRSIDMAEKDAKSSK